MSEDATLDEFIKSKDTETDEISTEKPEELDLGPRSLGLPDQWGKTEFGSTFSHQRGVNYSSDNYVSEGEGMIFLTLNAIAPGGGLKKDSLKFYDDDIPDEKTTTEGDILMANTDLNQDGEIIGYPVRVPSFESSVEKCFSHHLLKIEQKQETYDSQFLEYLFSADYIHDRMIAFSCGSTVLNLNTDLLDSLELPVPPIDEQRKIASVLYNVDQAIQKTEEIIEKLESVRRGTEQDVLSRGVLEDGSLREDDRIEYKNSWVGEVPKEWKIHPYNELITDSSVGIVVKPSQYYDDTGEVPILRSKDISRDGIVDGDFEYMTQESNEENANSQLRTGDIITVRSGEPGLSCVVSPEFDGSNCADLLISTPGESLNSHYAAMWINSRAGRKQIDRFQAGLAQKHFNLGALRKLRIAIPDIEEQQRIVEKVSSITESIEQENQYKVRLKRFKQGLMQDLLSGAVRTTDTNIQIPDEIAQHG